MFPTNELNDGLSGVDADEDVGDPEGVDRLLRVGRVQQVGLQKHKQALHKEQYKIKYVDALIFLHKLLIFLINLK